MASAPPLTGNERSFDPAQIIVSKTDLKGRLIYANELFLSIADFTEKDVIGQPHNIIRHPDMPRCIFALMWETIAAGNEMFAYVVNRTKFGDHYWVLAHVTPIRDNSGAIIGYHSSRRVPERSAVSEIQALYKTLSAEENRHDNAKQGMQAGKALLEQILRDKGQGYDHFIFQIIRRSITQKRAS